MAPKTHKRNTNRSKAHISSYKEDNLKMSDKIGEFLDQGVIKKAKKPTLRLLKVNAQTPCRIFFLTSMFRKCQGEMCT